MKNYNEQDEQYINMLVTERYWDDIKKAFGDMADTSLKRIHYNGVCYQCRMANDDFCIGAEYVSPT